MPSAASSRRTGPPGQQGFRMPTKEPDGATTDSLRQDRWAISEDLMISISIIWFISRDCVFLSSGTYTVRGVTYYEGQFHEDKIRTGVECEIFVEVARICHEVYFRNRHNYFLLQRRPKTNGSLLVSWSERSSPSHTPTECSCCSTSSTRLTSTLSPARSN